MGRLWDTIACSTDFPRGTHAYVGQGAPVENNYCQPTGKAEFPSEPTISWNILGPKGALLSMTIWRFELGRAAEIFVLFPASVRRLLPFNRAAPLDVRQKYLLILPLSDEIIDLAI